MKTKLLMLLALLGIFVSGCGCEIVDDGTVGVQRSWGAIQKNVLSPGFHTYNWFTDDILEMNIKIQSMKAESAGSSSDLQSVNAEVVVQYSVVPQFAPMLFKRLGGNDIIESSLLAPAIQESVKAATAKYTAEQLIQERTAVKAEMELQLNNYLESTLNEKEMSGAILVANVAITNFKFSPEFEAAIEAKVKADQEALKALTEKKKTITEAEGKAEARKAAADAEAYETAAISKARAEAITREAEALAKGGPDLIQLRTSERWDGKLPQFTGNGPVPLLQLK